MAEDDLVDVRLRELARLDRVLLRGAQEVVQEGHVELEHLDELQQAPVGDVELAVEVERARVGVRAVLGDLAVVEVAGQLGRVLVLLVLGLERADPAAVVLAQHEAPHPDVLDDLHPVAVVALHQHALVEAADRVELALERQVVVAAQLLVEPLEHDPARLERQEQQGLLVHRRVHHLTVDLPAERVERALGLARVLLQASLEQARDRALGRAHRTVQQQHAPLGAQPTGPGAHDLDQVRQRLVEPVDRVAPFAERVVEDLPAPHVPAPLVVVEAVRLDHVEQALPGVARDARLLLDQREVLLEAALPGELAEHLRREGLTDEIEEGFVGFGHGAFLLGGGRGSGGRGRCPPSAGSFDRSHGEAYLPLFDPGHAPT